MTKNILPAEQILTQMKDATLSQDEFAHYLAAPQRKLDADEYTANDLDGVTESATGSGNLNFLMMQAGQTNEAIGNMNPFEASQTAAPLLHGPHNDSGTGGFAPATSNGFDTAMDRGFDGADSMADLGRLNALGNNNTTAGSLSASNLAASATSVNPFTDVRNFASSTSSATPPESPSNGRDGSDGGNGTDGTPGEGGGDTIINNVTNVIDNTTTNLGDVINHTTTNLGDVINHTTTNLGDVLNTTTTNTFDTINNATTNIFDTINNTTNNVTNIVNNVLDGGNLGPLGIDLNLTINELTDVTLDFINGGIVTNILNETINTAPILTPVTNLVGTLLSSTSLHILYNPLQPDTAAGDKDLHVGTNLDLLGVSIPDLNIDVPLDIAEGLLGDLDINLDLTNDLLGGLPGNLLEPVFGNGGNGDTDLALGGLGVVSDVVNGVVSGILNPVENLTGDIDVGGALGLGLLGTDNNNGGADTDISIPIDLALIDSPLLEDGLQINLDPLEHITGDIDLDLGVAGNVLGNIAAPIFDSGAGGNGHNDLLNQVGNGLSDVVGDLLPFGNPADTDVALDLGAGVLGSGLVTNGFGLFLDPVEDIAGDIDVAGAVGLGLLGTADNGANDTDIILPVDFNLLGNAFLTDTISLDLDPVEHVIGDVDINLGAAGDLLGITAPDMFDDAAGGSGTDHLLAQVGHGLSHIGNELLPFDGDAGDVDVGLSTGVGAIDHVLLGHAAQIVIDPVEHLTGDIDLQTIIGADILGGAQTGGADTDLHIDLGLTDHGVLGQAVDITFDPVECVTGDIDLGIDLSSAIGGAVGAVVNPVLEPLASSFDETQHNLDSFTQDAANGIGIVADSLSGDADTLLAWAIPGVHETLENAGVIVDPVVANIETLGGTAHDGLVSLTDPLLGDLDALINSIGATLDTATANAITLLDSAAPVTGGLDLGALSGGIGADAAATVAVWTETVLPNAGDLLGGGLAADPVAAIPDPVLAAPVAALPAIVAAPVVSIVNTGGGLLGGLGGHHGHGGLFG